MQFPLGICGGMVAEALLDTSPSAHPPQPLTENEVVVEHNIHAPSWIRSSLANYNTKCNGNVM